LITDKAIVFAMTESLLALKPWTQCSVLPLSDGINTPAVFIGRIRDAGGVAFVARDCGDVSRELEKGNP